MRRQGPKRPARCSSCDAEIYWIKSRAGKNVPLDASAELEEFFAGYGDWPIDEGEAPTLQDLWDEVGRESVVAHFTTCPEADEHRRR